MKTKNLLISFLIIFIGWLLLTWSFAPISLLIGLVLATLLAMFFCRECAIFSEMKLTPKSLFYTFYYILVFLVELVKSNIDVTRRVLSPGLNINPGIVKVETKLKSKMARLILADSITLTPGTFTIEITGNTLYIHWIDVQEQGVNEATEAIVRKFEKILEEIYE